MSKKSYVLAIALLLAVMALAACGGSGAASSGGDSAATTEAGAAANAPAADATVTSEAQGQPVSAGSDTSGAGDTSGANATGEASAATDVGSGSDGAAGSGGSDAASGATSPESDTGAPAAGDDTGNAASGTGGTADASGNTSDSSGSAGGEGGAGDNNAQVATPAASYTAVSDAECTEVQGQLSQALGVEVKRATGVASFTDLNGGTGESCQLTAAGTGANFTSVPETAMQIRQVLSDNGWAVDEQYAADSPTATIGALRRDNQLAAYNVAWSPASGVTCPADQPISACAETLKPEQMNYTITVDLAQQ